MLWDWGLDVNEPTGIMVVDIGADTTEISVISLGGLVLSDLLHFGGNKIDESIITYVKRNYNLVIGQKTAQSMKERLGSGIPGNEDTMIVVGRDVVSGLPIEMEMSGGVVYEAIKDNLESICNSIKMILEKTPPELAKDIIHSWNLYHRLEVPRFMIWINYLQISQELISIPVKNRKSALCVVL